MQQPYIASIGFTSPDGKILGHANNIHSILYNVDPEFLEILSQNDVRY